MKIFIPILLGSARLGGFSEKAAKFVLNEAQTLGRFETQLLKVGDFVGPAKTEAMEKEKAGLWSAIMAKADGLIIVAPEYNHGYPGELKIMLDELYNEYNRKPAAVCGVSSGALGGARMVETLRTVLIELQMPPIHRSVYFANVTKIFDEHGELKDDNIRKKIHMLFEELLWYAEALKTAREKTG